MKEGDGKKLEAGEGVFQEVSVNGCKKCVVRHNAQVLDIGLRCFNTPKHEQPLKRFTCTIKRCKKKQRSIS